MRKIRDVIRLTLGEGLRLRQIGRSLDLPFTTVGDHVRHANAAGLFLAVTRRALRRRLGRAAVPTRAGQVPADAGLSPTCIKSCEKKE